MTCRSTSRRVVLSAQSSSARERASPSSVASSSSSARPGSPRRPAALIAGASVNDRPRGVMTRWFEPATAHSALMPGRSPRRMAAIARCTSRRFPSMSGTASATVARPARSMPISAAGDNRSPSRRRAMARVTSNTTPAAAGSASMPRPSAGLAMMPGGRAPPARWWSRTITSMPNSWARVRASTLDVPQSTVVNTRAPSSANRSTVASDTPYPSVKRLGRKVTTSAPRARSAPARIAVEHTPSQS